ncbi:acyl-CoA N-acyltransferase [Mycena alexandri]|uniref:Acyl-CoA N-acyltransferase n=1 Tax=Mycena alexandri TaxID=1745969 RepID=A0AAD6X0G6_9AGAR|nr:acyl-CoA N-acyltransferase [Mycena alexandri]KAJ7030276.1 acyl-CoA N-acyltransferase [Mycena alexandri]
MTSPSQYTIRPAELSDVPAMAALSADGFKTDRNTMVKAMGADPYDHKATMESLLPDWISLDPATRGWTVVAVENTTGEVAGWVSWGRAGYVPRATPTIPVDHDELERQAQAEPDPLARLGKLSSANFRRWMETKLMPPASGKEQCIYVSSISVAPSHQGRGVGQLLAQNGMAEADKDGVDIWVHGSEAAGKLFPKLGWKEIGEYDIDLDEYAIAPPPNGDAKWGHYVFKYMMYTPKPKA